MLKEITMHKNNFISLDLGDGTYVEFKATEKIWNALNGIKDEL